MAIIKVHAFAIGLVFGLWLIFLAGQKPFDLALGHNYEETMAKLNELHTAIKDYHALHGQYPVSQGWRLMGLLSTGPGKVDILELLRDSPAFTSPATAPALSLIYTSNGQDYKLLAHLRDRSPCLEAREKAPQIVDPARRAYTWGYLRLPGWPITSPEEKEAAKSFLRAQGKYPPMVDPALRQYLRGTCWAFGFWSQGAAKW